MNLSVTRRKFLTALTTTFSLPFWKPWLFASSPLAGGLPEAPAQSAGEELMLWFDKLIQTSQAGTHQPCAPREQRILQVKKIHRFRAKPLLFEPAEKWTLQAKAGEKYQVEFGAA